MPLPLFSSQPPSRSLPTGFGSPVKDATLKTKAINALQEVNIRHISFKAVAYTWLVVMIWAAWKISPFSGAWTLPQRPDQNAIRQTNIARYAFIHNAGEIRPGAYILVLLSLPLFPSSLVLL
jgi:hypothetical protein